MIRAENLFKSFGERELWNGLTFSVTPGSIVAIVGHSGAGKTTLLNCAGGLEEPDRGRLYVKGRLPASLGRRARTMYWRETVCFLFQNSGLVDEWSVSRNLDLAIEPMRIKPREAKFHKARVLERVGLTAALNHPVHLLSGGERQRVALARFMLKRGDVVLADEPSSALDDHNCKVLWDAIQERRDAGAAVLVSTHDPRIIDACDRVLRIGSSTGQSQRR